MPDEIRRATPAGTELIVLPEKVGRVSEEVLPEVDCRCFRRAATATGATIDSGSCVELRRVLSIRRASIRQRVCAGELRTEHHLLFGVEPETAGKSERTGAPKSAGQPRGPADLQGHGFSALSREYARDGANLLLVPAWDFDLDRWLHARMAVLRGVENGFAVARAGATGF